MQPHCRTVTQSYRIRCSHDTLSVIALNKTLHMTTAWTFESLQLAMLLTMLPLSLMRIHNFVFYKEGWILGGLRWAEPPLLTFLLMLGSWAPPKTLALAWLFRVYWLCFQSAMINYALLYGYWGISYCWLYYISVKLNYHVSIFGNMGVVVAGPHPIYGCGCAQSPPC